MLRPRPELPDQRLATRPHEGAEHERNEDRGTRGSHTRRLTSTMQSEMNVASARLTATTDANEPGHKSSPHRDRNGESDQQPAPPPHARPRRDDADDRQTPRQPLPELFQFSNSRVGELTFQILDVTDAMPPNSTGRGPWDAAS